MSEQPPENVEKLSSCTVVTALKLAEHGLAALSKTVPVTNMGAGTIMGVAFVVREFIAEYARDPRGRGTRAAELLNRAVSLFETAQDSVVDVPPERPGWLSRLCGGGVPKNVNAWCEGEVGKEALTHIIEELYAVIKALEEGQVDVTATAAETATTVKVTVFPTPYGYTVQVVGYAEDVPAVLASLAAQFGLEIDPCGQCRYGEICPHSGECLNCAGVPLETPCGQCQYGEICPHSGECSNCAGVPIEGPCVKCQHEDVCPHAGEEPSCSGSPAPQPQEPKDSQGGCGGNCDSTDAAPEAAEAGTGNEEPPPEGQ